MMIILERTEGDMSGPIFVVELKSGLWMNSSLFTTDRIDKAKRFTSEIQAICSLDHYRRYSPWPDAKIVRIDE